MTEDEMAGWHHWLDGIMDSMDVSLSDTGEIPEVPQDPCWHWRGILRSRHRLHTMSEAPASMGEESRVAPSNSNEDWPFLRPPERVPEVPVVTRETLPNSRKSRHSTRNGHCSQQYLPQTDFFPAPATRLKTIGTNILGRYQDLSLLKLNPILIFAKEAPAATSCRISFPAFFSL